MLKTLRKNKYIKSSRTFAKNNKFIFLILFFFIVVINSFFILGSSDIIVFSIILLYILLINFYKLDGKATFSLCLCLLVIMYVAFLFSGTSPQTEEVAVMLILLMAVGIVQQWNETNGKQSESMIEKISNLFNKVKKIVYPIFYIKNFWILYLDVLNKVKSKRVIYKLWNGIVLHATSKNADGLIINEVWGSKVYTPSGFEIKDDDIVVDIGAHKGYFSIYAAYYAKKGKVISFEPTDMNYAFLTKNISTNKAVNISSYKLGIGKDNKTKNIYYLENKAGGISELKDWFKGEKDVKSVKIKTMPLDDVFKRCNITHIDFMKIDCEGAEYEILLNASKATLKKIKKISMEFHEIGNLRAKTLIQLLEKNGFNCKINQQNGSIGMLYAYKK